MRLSQSVNVHNTLSAEFVNWKFRSLEVVGRGVETQLPNEWKLIVIITNLRAFKD